MRNPQRALKTDIDRRHALPIYLQICERFRAAIGARHLKPGDRVPALCALATQLNTARGTVELAYDILVDEGLSPDARRGGHFCVVGAAGIGFELGSASGLRMR